MGKDTEISWTDATFSPWWGCQEVSPACDHCYARTFAKRVGRNVWGKDEPRWFPSEKYWEQLQKWNKAAQRAGKATNVFVGSMCDIMEDRPDLRPHRERLYGEAERTPFLNYLLLTKRPQNFRRFLPTGWLKDPLPNVWLLTTVESTEYLWRADTLRFLPAAVHGLSMEPLLGDAPTLHEHLDGIDWVIAGGESGGHARPSQASWFRSIRDQCQEAGVPFHMKQWGDYAPARLQHIEGAVNKTNGKYHFEVDPTGNGPVRRLRKKNTGSLLDGVDHKAFPVVA